MLTPLEHPALARPVSAPPEPRSAIVIPTFNERENLEAVVTGVLEAIDGRVLIVDDDSPDRTGELADALARAEPRLGVLHRGYRAGLASAYRDGFREVLAGGATHVFQLDADGSHDPATLAVMLASLGQADLVLGSRYVDGGETVDRAWHRELISRAGSLYSRTLLGIPTRDVTTGYKGWRAALLAELLAGPIAANGFVFQVEMTERAIRSGARVVEVPIRFRDRQAGRSKFGPGIIVEASWRLAARRARGLGRGVA